MAAKLSPVDYVRQYNPALAESFGGLRQAAVSGPLSEESYELIVVAALVTTRDEGSFKVHVRRLRNMGTAPEAMRQAVTATLAASSTFGQVVGALRWIDDVLAEGA
jgi:alkylhydroperoxidase/carboxymuconolactone decarboxylase family protein YurZ